MTWAKLAPLDPSTPEYEHLEQVRFFNLLSNLNHPAVEMTFAVPNQAVALLRKTKRVWFSAEGVKAGAPDIYVDFPVHPFHGLRMEMKRPGERPTPAQLAWHARLRQQGFFVVVCFSAQQAFRAWLDYLGYEAEFT
jgi:hypothetical protein